MRAINLRNEQGFTLIELMIVVGIIGILVAIAAPNFSKYQSKARQSEAKIGLSAIYGAEKSFYSEYSAYLSSLDGVGYAPEGSKRFYNIGFAAGQSGTIGGYSGEMTNNSNFPAVNNPYTGCGTAAALGAGLSGNAQTFDANASGCIRNSSGNFDNWTIDETKSLKNTKISL